MTKYIVICFINLCAALWLAELISGKFRGGVRGVVSRVAPGLCVIAMMLLDSGGLHHGMPASLLTADLLFLDSVFLHIREGRGGPLAAAAAFSAACLARSALQAAGCAMPFDPAALVCVASALFLVFCSLRDGRMLAQRRRDAIPDKADRIRMKVACSQSLAFAGVLLLALSSADSGFSAVAVPVIAVILVLLYAGLYITSVFRKAPIRLSFASQPSQDQAQSPADEKQRMDALFQKVEAYMKRERPYLNEEFTLAGLATEMLTNKGMLSRTINAKSGRNFCQYVNKYRIQYAVSLMEKDHRLRVVELSLMCGFHSVASFNMAFKLFMHDTPSEYLRTLQAKDGLGSGTDGR